MPGGGTTRAHSRRIHTLKLNIEVEQASTSEAGLDLNKLLYFLIFSTWCRIPGNRKSSPHTHTDTLVSLGSPNMQKQRLGRLIVSGLQSCIYLLWMPARQMDLCCDIPG